LAALEASCRIAAMALFIAGGFQLRFGSEQERAVVPRIHRISGIQGAAGGIQCRPGILPAGGAVATVRQMRLLDLGIAR
jgi:hypothetical protein